MISTALHVGKHGAKAALMLWFLFALSSHAEVRTWKSNDGKEIVGEWLRDSGDGVVLKVRDKEFTIPLSRLSEEDRKWVVQRRETEAEELAARNKEFTALAGTTKTFPKVEGQQVPFHVYYPTTYSADSPPPMILLFSASGRGRVLLDQFKDACEKHGWIGVGMDVFRNGVSHKEMTPLFVELLPVIEKSVVHDPNRLYLGGMSGGAARAFMYSAWFDRPWKGVVSCGGWLAGEYDLEFRKNMAVAWVNGDKDANANGNVPKDTQVLEKRGCKTERFSFPGGHEMGPPDVLAEAMAWIIKNTKQSE